jgi:hypothetical protein
VRVYLLCRECVGRIQAFGRAKLPDEEPLVFIV